MTHHELSKGMTVECRCMECGGEWQRYTVVSVGTVEVVLSRSVSLAEVEALYGDMVLVNGVTEYEIQWIAELAPDGNLCDNQGHEVELRPV